MAKVLTELPEGFAKASITLPASQKPPSGASKTSSAAQKGDGRVSVPKARQRPGSGQRMNEYSEWMMRRCDAFGIASSKYFKKNGTCPTPKAK